MKRLEEDNLFKIFLIQDEQDSLKKMEQEKGLRLSRVQTEIDKVAASNDELKTKMVYKAERNKLLMNVIHPADEAKKTHQ